VPDDSTLTPPDGIHTAAEELIEDFSFLDDWEDRFRYVIDLGKALEPMDDSLKTEESKVRGCTSQVWIVPDETTDGQGRKVLSFLADSDAHIVRGLIAILLRLYSGRTPQEILSLDIKGTIDRLGFAQHLSPNRANGLFSMVERIRGMAQAVG